MPQFIGFHVTGDPEDPRKTTPVATGTTRKEAVTSAMRRLRALRLGYLQVQQRDDVSPEDFDRLTAVLDAYFDRLSLGPLGPRLRTPFAAGA